jgi:hypothetical protein
MSRRPRPKHAIALLRPLPPVRARAGAGGSAGVQLAWARDREGRKVRAAGLAPADRRGRAPFRCLGCGEELVPHLGRVRTPHFAHRPGSTCPLTSPETALHLDAKERLLALCAEAFAGRRRVRLLARCPGCRRTTPLALEELGDRAAAEGAVGLLRADVLVSSGERPALAVEILVTHAVEPEKEAALLAAGVPAVEVDARAEWEREVEGGVDVACARSFGFGPCPACRGRAWADAEREKGGEAAEIAELEAYRARGLLGDRSGSKLGGGTSAALERGDDADAPLTAAEWRALEAEFACPECGARSLERGARLARHTCPAPPGVPGEVLGRPVAWRGFDGSLVTLGWWRRGPGPAARARGKGQKAE